MTRKPRPEEHDNQDRWLVSYADFMTLLFAFFTSMYAISNLDLQKAGRLVMSVQAAFNSPVMSGGSNALGNSQPVSPGDGSMLVPSLRPDGQREAESESENGVGAAIALRLDALEKILSAALNDGGLNAGVTVHRVGRELALTLGETIFFTPGSADLLPHALPVLEAIARVLGPTAYAIRIEGHTDDRPIHSARFPSNWELSSARATAILRDLVERRGIQPSRLAAAGYGPYRPAAGNESVEGRARNRRVEIVVVGELATDAAGQAATAAGQAATAAGTEEP